jgi:hypothetical protein
MYEILAEWDGLWFDTEGFKEGTDSLKHNGRFY